MRHNLLGAICTTFIAFLAPLTSMAFEVQPMRHHITPAEGASGSQFSVRNQRSAALPVEIIIQRRVFDDKGVMTLIDAEDDFLVFPFQALIEAGKSQTFQFQYLGDPNIGEEMAYTIDVREVPVDLPDGFTGVRVVYNFGIAVYLDNPDIQSDIVVKQVVRQEDALDIRLINESHSFARLSNDRVVLEQGDMKVVLEGSDLTGRIDTVVVAPNRSKDISLTLEGLDFKPGEIRVTLQQESE